MAAVRCRDWLVVKGCKKHSQVLALCIRMREEWHSHIEHMEAIVEHDNQFAHFKLQLGTFILWWLVQKAWFANEWRIARTSLCRDILQTICNPKSSFEEVLAKSLKMLSTLAIYSCEFTSTKFSSEKIWHQKTHQSSHRSVGPSPCKAWCCMMRFGR